MPLAPLLHSSAAWEWEHQLLVTVASGRPPWLPRLHWPRALLIGEWAVSCCFEWEAAGSSWCASGRLLGASCGLPSCARSLRLGEISPWLASVIVNAFPSWWCLLFFLLIFLQL